jgi:putative aldouronate transport system permease protein
MAEEGNMTGGISVTEKAAIKEQHRRNRKHLWKQVKRCRTLYLMILPAVVSVFIFHYIPIYGVQIAFKDYRTSQGILGSKWVGLKYFKQFIEYPYFGKIMWNTIRISLCCLITFPIPVLFSIQLDELRNQKFKKVSQMITYAPHFVSTVVVCSMLILFLDSDGLIGRLAGRNLLAEPAWFAPIYAISDLWQGLGWGTIIYLATLAGISMELVEAAEIDGAGRLQIIRYVKLPHLRNTIITLFILKIGQLISVGFEKTFLLQNSLNLDASSIISTYVYEVGITNHKFSYSSAIGLFNNIINVILVVSANTIAKKFSETSLW